MFWKWRSGLNCALAVKLSKIVLIKNTSEPICRLSAAKCNQLVILGLWVTLGKTKPIPREIKLVNSGIKPL